MTKTKSYSVLFVCMANICRSLTAHGVFRHKVYQLRLIGQGFATWAALCKA